MAGKTDKRIVTVHLNLQQYKVLEDVKRWRSMGRNDAEVIRRAFLKWYEQTRKTKKEGQARRSQRSR